MLLCLYSNAMVKVDVSTQEFNSNNTEKLTNQISWQNNKHMWRSSNEAKITKNNLLDACSYNTKWTWTLDWIQALQPHCEAQFETLQDHLNFLKRERWNYRKKKIKIPLIIPLITAKMPARLFSFSPSILLFQLFQRHRQV